MRRLAGGLLVVGLPIGNSADVSQRARNVLLRQCELVACENVQSARRILGALRKEEGGDGAGESPQLVHLTDHQTESSPAFRRALEAAQGGAVVALISEAGTPLVSDPGALLVSRCHDAGVRVSPVPGPCAVSAALSCLGFPSARFSFEGFLPRKQSQRVARLTQCAAEGRTLVFFEGPHRICRTLEDCVEVWGASHPAGFMREGTKVHEEVFRGTLQECLQLLLGSGPGEQHHPTKGEFTVVLGPRKGAG